MWNEGFERPDVPYVVVNVTADDATLLVRWVSATHALSARHDYLGFTTRTTFPLWVPPVLDLATARTQLDAAIAQFRGP